MPILSEVEELGANGVVSRHEKNLEFPFPPVRPHGLWPVRSRSIDG